MKDKQKTYLDAERENMEMITFPLSIVFTFIMSLMSASLFLWGGFHGGAQMLDDIEDQNVLFFIGGFCGFSLFFSWFLILDNSRHLLSSIKRLEKEIECIKKEKIQNEVASPNSDSAAAKPE
jgi:hypothetical protein